MWRQWRRGRAPVDFCVFTRCFLYFVFGGAKVSSLFFFPIVLSCCCCFFWRCCLLLCFFLCSLRGCVVRSEHARCSWLSSLFSKGRLAHCPPLCPPPGRLVLYTLCLSSLCFPFLPFSTHRASHLCSTGVRLRFFFLFSTLPAAFLDGV